MILDFDFFESRWVSWEKCLNFFSHFPSEEEQLHWKLNQLFNLYHGDFNEIKKHFEVHIEDLKRIHKSLNGRRSTFGNELFVDVMNHFDSLERKHDWVEIIDKRNGVEKTKQLVEEKKIRKSRK